MHEINSDGSVNGEFVAADAQIGQVATEVNAPWLNTIQREIKNVVQGSNQTLNPADDTQLLQGIRNLVGSSSTRNVLINGDFRLNQRAGAGTISNGTPIYIHDRWRFNPGTGNTNTLTITSTGYIPPDPVTAMRWSQTSQLNGSTNPTLGQRIESIYTLSAGLATLSFKAKCNTGQSTTITPKLRQFYGSGGNADVVTTGTVINIGDQWVRYTVTFNVPAVNTGGSGVQAGHYLELLLEIPKTYASFFDIADIQLELGSAPTQYERLNDTVLLAMARRYFEKSYIPGHAPGTSTNSGLSGAYAAGADVVGLAIRFMTQKLATPTVKWWSSTGTADNITYNAADRAVTGTVGTSVNGTGYPQTASQAASNALAHWTAESEL